MNQPLNNCEKCGALTATRQIGTGAGFIFKGTGFYSTDKKQKPKPGKLTAADKLSEEILSRPPKGYRGR
jgi:predicted nucleic acid-binding Zn ribbon protein